MVRYFLNLTGDKVNNSHQVSVIRQYAQILFNSIVHDKVFLMPLWMPIMKVCIYSLLHLISKIQMFIIVIKI